MNGKWTAALAAVAFALAVLAAAPLADSAREVFAADADRVDGIHAARTPKPGALVALGANAKLPKAVVPTVAGPRGAQGPAGPQGAAGLSGYVRVTATSAVDGTDWKYATASCPAGTRVLGGGAIIGSPQGEHQSGVFIGDSFPEANREAWTVGASEAYERGAVWGLWVTAICASVAS